MCLMLLFCSFWCLLFCLLLGWLFAVGFDIFGLCLRFACDLLWYLLLCLIWFSGYSTSLFLFAFVGCLCCFCWFTCFYCLGDVLLLWFACGLILVIGVVALLDVSCDCSFNSVVWLDFVYGYWCCGFNLYCGFFFVLVCRRAWLTVILAFGFVIWLGCWLLGLVLGVVVCYLCLWFSNWFICDNVLLFRLCLLVSILFCIVDLVCLWVLDSLVIVGV